MKKLFLISVIFTALMTIPQLSYSQDKVMEPYIISFVPDSLNALYQYSQTVFVTVSVGSRLGSDPTERAIQDLQKKIIETCKLNKMDAFILKDLVFAKPFDEGKLIGYGTMIRLKAKQP